MSSRPDDKKDAGAGCLARFYWMLVGNAILAVAFISLLQKHPAFPAVWDALCLLVVASLVLVRYIDVRYLKGNTGEGVPATIDHWRVYSIILVSGSLCFWLIIRFLVPVRIF